MTRSGTGSTPIGHGFVHLPTMKRSIAALYARLGAEAVAAFAASVPPQAVTLPPDRDVVIGVQHVASSLIRHLRLPQARVIVAFGDMDVAGRVELAGGPEYFVDLHSRYRTETADIAAVLCHEVLHVYLHRHGVVFPETLDNELGYVIALRSRRFGDQVKRWVKGSAAREALAAGTQLARTTATHAPLADSGWWDRLRYRRDQRRALAAPGNAAPVRPPDPYQFEVDPSGRSSVVFECAVCFRRLRAPTGRRATIRCPSCGWSAPCDT